MPLRIAMLVQNKVGSGTYWRAFYFARELVRLGHSVTVLANSPTHHLRWKVREIDGVRLVETADLLPGRLRSGWDPLAVIRRCVYILRHPHDIVHAFESRPTVIVPALLAKARGATLLMDWCDWFGRGGIAEERPTRIERVLIRHVDTFLENAFRRQADGTTVISTFLRDLARAHHLSDDSILLIRNGAYLAEHPVPKSEARLALRIAAADKVIGYVGHVYLRRDARFIAAALDRVRARFPDCRLLFIGAPSPALHAEVLNPQAILDAGWSAAPHSLLSACDVCWMPMDDCGANQARWALKISDYLSAGKPIVATRVGDLPSYIDDSQIGVCSSPDPADFADSTIRLLDDPALCERMGASSRMLAAGEFHWTMVTGRLEEFYRSTLSRRKNTGAPRI